MAKSVFPDELLQFMQGGERYTEAWLDGKRAAAGYSPSLVCNPRRELTKREEEGFVTDRGKILNLNTSLTYNR
jgi:hypothetical protein